MYALLLCLLKVPFLTQVPMDNLSYIITSHFLYFFRALGHDATMCATVLSATPHRRHNGDTLLQIHFSDAIYRKCLIFCFKNFVLCLLFKISLFQPIP